MPFRFQIPEINGTPINLGGSNKIRSSSDLINRIKTALSLVVQQLFNIQLEALTTNPNTPANRLEDKLIKLAKTITNNSAERERYALIILEAGIARGIFYHNDLNTEYVVPENVDQIIIDLITSLLNNPLLIDTVVQ